MKLLLIVGSANDVFIVNMAKWLKASMEEDIDIDVFEWLEDKQQTPTRKYYNEVCSDATYYRFCYSGYGTALFPFLQSCALKHFLRNKYYDIIHCHWITPSVIISAKGIRKHCNKMMCTFWGREWVLMKIFNSNKVYRYYLKTFLQLVDIDVNSASFGSRILPLYPFMESKFRLGNLGAAAADSINRLLQKSNSDECKNYYGIPTNKISVQIGYSSKILHQHLYIIKELEKHPQLKSSIHLLAPMTRGGGGNYIDEVENALKQSGYTYTLLRDLFLTEEEVGILRCSADIILQLSTTDGFSRSIIEAFCAKSIIIYGNWLNYEDHLSAGGYKAIAADSIETGINKLLNVVANMSQYKEMVESNSVVALRSSSWSECIRDWVDVYRSVM